MTNDPSTPGTQVDPQAPADLGEAPVSSVNSGSAESPEEPPVTRNIVPAIAAAMILAAVGIVLIRKRK